MHAIGRFNHKCPRITLLNENYDRYKEMYDFMKSLLDKTIAKWPWLYSTYSEKECSLDEPYYGDEGKIEIHGPRGRFVTETIRS